MATTTLPAKALQAKHIIDGDTFITDEGEKVRLLDINTPETSKKGKTGQPYSQKAKEKIASLLEGQNITLKKGATNKDRYGRTLAHVYTNTGVWVNKVLVEEGLAHVYSFPDNRLFAAKLLPVEDKARTEKRGIWSLKRWQPLNANQVINLQETVGQFHLVEGIIKDVGESTNMLYLNFGDNWREDFTAEVRKKDLPAFKGTDLADNPRSLIGKHVRVRGIIKPVNGALITLTHPEQLTILK